MGKISTEIICSVPGVFPTADVYFRAWAVVAANSYPVGRFIQIMNSSTDSTTTVLKHILSLPRDINSEIVNIATMGSNIRCQFHDRIINHFTLLVYDETDLCGRNRVL